MIAYARRLSRPPELRPFALTMPAVTVKSRPSGLPIARTHWPTRALASSPRRRVGQILAVDLDDGDVGRRIAADDLRAWNVRLSNSVTVTLSASATT